MNVYRKSYKFLSISLIISFLGAYTAFAQEQNSAHRTNTEERLSETPLVENQNPRYLYSYRKYSTPEQINKLTMGQSTTLQQTYKAIDPWQDKKDARRDRRNNRYKLRHERRMARIQNQPIYGGGYWNSPAYSIVPDILDTALWLSLWWR